MPPLWILLVLLPVLGGAERFNCRGRILGAYYADAKSGCKAFHVCVRVAGGGIRDFRFFCPPGTLFHQEAQTCTDWGDDDPLACPADIYDGQFDLYKIGSGFDTKKLSSSGNRDEESEFGLQRAETGDRRLSQNNGASDLRAAHSSDFFSGQRDRGRDDPVPAPAAPQAPAQPAQHTQARQSFRRPTTPRATPSTTQYTNPPTPPPQPTNPPQYDINSKRKLVRKRPVYVSTTVPPTTYSQYTQTSQHYSEQPQQNYNRRIVPLSRQTLPPVNVPPQYKEYKDEYVEVSRVTPKPGKFFQSQPPAPFTQSTSAPTFNNNNKKDGLVELYNYDAQSTPGLNLQTTQKDNRPFKVRNSFNVADAPRENDYFLPRNNNANTNNVRQTPTTVDYNVSPTRSTTSAQNFKNFNSVSFEPEKNNFLPYSKQNHLTNPTTSPSTSTYATTSRSDPPLNLNTVAYNTNLGFNTHQASFADNDEDDGQYRPPQGEDDGQYRPELYERELLSGAHSLNIAASGNRLPEDQKPKGKTQPPFKPVAQTAAPRPFRPAPTSTSAPTQRVTEQTYPTTIRAQTQPQTQRTFDYYQTYTTTSRPNDAPAPPVAFNNFDVATNPPARPTTTLTPIIARNPEPRPQSKPTTHATQPPAPVRPTTRQPFYAKPSNNKEDNSYDYAYYDSDPGFAEYDHIEEFGRTKTKA